jgi:hypothetical protein
MRGQRGAYGGACGALLAAMTLLALLSLCCGTALAGHLEIRPEGQEPLFQIEEFVPGATHVNADFYAFLFNPLGRETTVSLQYASSSGYDPQAADPYAAGVTVPLGTTAASLPQLHAHLVLEPDQVYHYRVLASNTEESFETPDQTVNTVAPSQGVLPDARAYEQVSPVDKNNVDALGISREMDMQASPSSSAPAFAFFSQQPFPIATGMTGLTVAYVSSRSPSPAWLTQGVQAPLAPGEDSHDEVSGFTEDLSRTILSVEGPPLAPLGVTNAYVRDNATGSYQLLAPHVSYFFVLLVDASRDDSKILFETEQQLLPAAVAGKKNLYEWDEAKPEGERLTVAGLLPTVECGCAPANGSGAGQGGSENQGSQEQGYLQNTISEDGSKVFFTAHPSGRIYEREPLSELAPVTVPVSPGAATFLAATPSGQYVFYAEGGELYRFDTASETRETLTSGAEVIRGSLGVSDDGTYAYFVANGKLAANQNANREEATKGAPNLYVWHEDPPTHTVVTTFIARLLPMEQEGDASDWFNSDRGGEEGKTSRVTPSGTTLLFKSRASLTGYDNGQPGSSACTTTAGQIGLLGIPCSELFLYRADEPFSPTNPVCVSCNPTGAVARANAHLGQGEIELAVGETWSSHLTRNLSASGDRVFFETTESLVPQDTNGRSDVYEWEREGLGSCPPGSGHCLYLISTGTAHGRSFFGDADAEGENVFFFTRQPLVGQDHDLNIDVYDGRVGGGIAAQNPHFETCEGEATCRPAGSAAPLSVAPASVQLMGTGNLLAPTSVITPRRCTGGRSLSHGKCVIVRCAEGQKLKHGKCVIVRCAKGRKLKHGKCVKVHGPSKTRARKAAGAAGRGGRG